MRNSPEAKTTRKCGRQRTADQTGQVDKEPRILWNTYEWAVLAAAAAAAL